MRSELRKFLGALLGGMLLAAALLVTPLGVRMARADSEGHWTHSPLFSLGGVPDGDRVSQCRPGQAPKLASSRNGAMAQVAARVKAELAAGEDPGIALNGSGYNYRNATDPWVELQRVQREARQLRP